MGEVGVTVEGGGRVVVFGLVLGVGVLEFPGSKFRADLGVGHAEIEVGWNFRFVLSGYLVVIRELKPEIEHSPNLLNQSSKFSNIRFRKCRRLQLSINFLNHP